MDEGRRQCAPLPCINFRTYGFLNSLPMADLTGIVGGIVIGPGPMKLSDEVRADRVSHGHLPIEEMIFGSGPMVKQHCSRRRSFEIAKGSQTLSLLLLFQVAGRGLLQ